MRTTVLFLCLTLSWSYAAAEFKYAPAASTAAPAGVTLTVGDVSYKANRPILKDFKPWFMYAQFETLKDSLRRDLEAILKAKGLGVRGPFDSYDLIPYQDKKNIDLYLSPAVELRVNTPEEIRSYNDIKVEVDGNIAVELREVFTRELMWAKKVPFTVFTVPHNLLAVSWKENLPKAIRLDNTTPKAVQWFYVDPEGLAAGIAQGFEAQYPVLLGTFDTLIDPEEMAVLRKQCQEVKSKKGY